MTSEFFSAWACTFHPNHVFTFNEPFLVYVMCPECVRAGRGTVQCRKLGVYSKRKGGAAPPGPAVLIDRTTIFGNPFVVGQDGTRAECIKLFREWARAEEQEWLRRAARYTLRGQDLLCWCAPKACHGDVWLEIANTDELWNGSGG